MFLKKNTENSIIFVPYSQISAVVYSKDLDEYLVVVPGYGKLPIDKQTVESYHNWYKMEAYGNVRINTTTDGRPGWLIQMNDIEKVHSWKKYSNTEFQVKLKDFDDWLDVAEKDRMLVSKYKYGIDDKIDNVHIKEMNDFFNPQFKPKTAVTSSKQHQIWKILHDANNGILRTEQVLKKGLGVGELDKETQKISRRFIKEYMDKIEDINDYVLNLDRETITPEKLNEITTNEKDRNIVAALFMYLFSEDGKFPNKFIWKMIEPKGV